MQMKIGEMSVGDEAPLLLVAGPCVIESEELCVQIAESVALFARKHEMNYVFKASFDKANRTSLDSYRGPGMEEGLRILTVVRERVGVPVLTDVHEPAQVAACAEAVDILQVPAFLCRQTDLLLAVGRSGKPVNIKKGQFLDPRLMRHAADKVASTGNRQVLLCERGAFFGYNDLVADMRSIVLMRGLGHPVLFDATHSVQRPGGRGGASGGDADLAAPLALAALAAGADGLFIETHPAPERALSDRSTMLPLGELPALLEKALAVFKAARE